MLQGKDFLAQPPALGPSLPLRFKDKQRLKFLYNIAEEKHPESLIHTSARTEFVLK